MLVSLFRALGVSSFGPSARPLRHVTAARRVASWLAHGLCALLLAGVLPAMAQSSGSSNLGAGTIRFGILPLGGAFESRNDWEPLLADLSRAIGRPVTMLSVTSYEALEQAIQRNQVDMAFLSGKMALDAVTLRRMNVVDRRRRRQPSAVRTYSSLYQAKRMSWESWSTKT